MHVFFNISFVDFRQITTSRCHQPLVQSFSLRLEFTFLSSLETLGLQSSRDNIFGRKFISSAQESLLSEKTKIQINTSTERNRVAKRSMKSFLLCNVPELNKDLHPQTSLFSNVKPQERFRVTFSHLFIQNSSNLLVSKLVFHEFWKL